MDDVAGKAGVAVAEQRGDAGRGGQQSRTAAAIAQLPPLLVNQIAAGEVIERPASVVKELIDNAIDAHASRIDIIIEEGGIERITVRDDGHGIGCDQLHLALAPHATSKIRTAADLDAIGSMGFRGEALASITSVSRLPFISRTDLEASGWMIEAEGDVELSEPQPQPHARGTTITIRNLFFNTPARRKFLRTAVTEASRCVEVVEQLAMSHPHIAFSLRTGSGSSERVRLDLPAEHNDPRRRVLRILGSELEEQLLEVNTQRGEDDHIVSLFGLIGLPEIARHASTHQRFFLNGRPIRDRSLQHAVKEAYRGLIEPGRWPTLVLFIEMNPRMVDVNVHPAKAEVRFRNQTLIHGIVMSSVRERLRAADLTPAVAMHDAFGKARFERPGSSAATMMMAAGTDQQQTGDGEHGGERASPAGTTFLDYFQRLDPVQKGFVYSEVKQALEDAEGEHAPAERLVSAQPAAHVLQVHHSYLVTQDERGLVIIDQHALHERIMFEKLKQRITQQGALESQLLLVPEILELDQQSLEVVNQLGDVLKAIGIDAQPISTTALAVHAFATFLFERNVQPQPFLQELIERVQQGEIDPGHTSSDSEAALHEVLDMMACKAAIKAGDHLSQDELTALLAQRSAIERASNCPHGRPTSLRLSIDELNRQFGRS
ncbi:MAG: DNA mismatch repair endonuclease MutL [Phycisphaerales bacterium]